MTRHTARTLNRQEGLEVIIPQICAVGRNERESGQRRRQREMTSIALAPFKDRIDNT